jgi:hypothetical protein
MKYISRFGLPLTVAVLVLLAVSVFAQTRSQTQSQSQSTTSARSTESDVQFKPGPAVKAKAASPAPSPNAEQKAKKGSIGEGKAMIQTRGSNNDFWVEQIDLEGNGQKSETQLLWDSAEKTLFMYGDRTLTCKNGDMAMANLLIAVYGNGNMSKKPVGSGWWAASLEEGKCAMKTDTLYGCKFDQKGNNTACGVAELDQNTHELTIVEARTTEIR